MDDITAMLKAIIKDQGISQVDIAREFGVSPQAIYNKFNRGTWYFDEVVRILRLANCRLVVESEKIRRYEF